MSCRCLQKNATPEAVVRKKFWTVAVHRRLPSRVTVIKTIVKEAVKK